MLPPLTFGLLTGPLPLVGTEGLTISLAFFYPFYIHVLKKKEIALHLFTQWCLAFRCRKYKKRFFC